MPKLTFQWNSVPKSTLGAEVHRLVPKLLRAEVTRAEHRLPHSELSGSTGVYIRRIRTEQVALRREELRRWLH